jgi:hypothetical protein
VNGTNVEEVMPSVCAGNTAITNNVTQVSQNGKAEHGMLKNIILIT